MVHIDMYISVSAQSRLKLLVAILCINASGEAVMAQEKSHAVWKVDAVRINDQEVMIRFDVAIDSGWHIYSVINPIEHLRLNFFFDKSDEYELVGSIHEGMRYIEKYDEVFGQRLRMFERNASFSQRVKLVRNHQVIKGSIRFVTNSGNSSPSVQGFSFSVAASTVNRQVSKTNFSNH